MNFIKITLIIVLPIIAAIISWLLSGYFISRKEHYNNSKYGITMKKLSWSFFWLIFTAIVVIEFFGKK